MNLPKQVKRQNEQADAVLAAVNAPAPVPAPVATAPAPEPTAAPAPAPAAEATPPSPAPAKVETEETWEHRYRSLQGIHNAHVADLKQRLNATKDELATLRAELDAVRKAAPAPAAEPAAVDPKDAETFGADIVQMVMRVADTRFTAMAAKLEARITELETRQKGTSQAVAMTAEEVFLGRLKDAVPDYEAINVDPAFLAWLAEVDPVYGQPRQAALTAAAEALDAVRVANVFKAFKNTLAPAPAPAAPVPASELERQVAPSTGAAATQLRPEAPPAISSAFVQKFYRDVASGRYRGRDAEVAQIEAQINQALAEGRIT